MKKIKWNILEELQSKFWIDTLEWQDMILKELKKKMLESALEWELWYELWYKKWKRRISSFLGYYINFLFFKNCTSFFTLRDLK